MGRRRADRDERRTAEERGRVIPFSRAADGLLAVLLAPACAACNASLPYPARGPVCQSCWDAIRPFTPPLCRRCGDPLPSWRVISVEAGVCPRCRRRPSALTESRAIGAYDGSLRAIVHAFKYGGCRSLARGLGARLRESAAGLLGNADIVVPVPLHRSRRRGRGFNQARELARHLGLPLVDALRRTRATPSQTDLPAAAAPRQRARRVCARAPAAAVARAERRRPADCARRRCEHDRGDDRGVRARASCGWRRRRQRGDGSASRVSTARMTSAVTSALPRSPSSLTQPGAAA